MFYIWRQLFFLRICARIAVVQRHFVTWLSLDPIFTPPILGGDAHLDLKVNWLHCGRQRSKVNVTMTSRQRHSCECGISGTDFYLMWHKCPLGAEDKRIIGARVQRSVSQQPVKLMFGCNSRINLLKASIFTAAASDRWVRNPYIFAAIFWFGVQHKRIHNVNNKAMLLVPRVTGTRSFR